jgi:hypothetical protein
VSIKSRIKGAIKGAVNFVKGMLPGQSGRSAVNLEKWRPAVKGEIGHAQRRWVPISAKTITEKTPFIAGAKSCKSRGANASKNLSRNAAL